MSSVLRLVLIIFASTLLASCIVPAPNDQSSARAVVTALYARFQSGRYDDALGLLRTKDGTALTAASQGAIKQSWESALKDSGFHVTTINFTGERPLEDDARALLPAGADAVRLTFDVDGVSDAKCWKLPVKNATVSLAQIDGRWYVLEELHFPGSFVVRC